MALAESKNTKGGSMIQIEGGQFTMGINDPKGMDGESPEKKVIVNVATFF